jgi:hypothetical protein
MPHPRVRQRSARFADRRDLGGSDDTVREFRSVVAAARALLVSGTDLRRDAAADWNPDIENSFNLFDQWQKMPEQLPMDNVFKRQWERLLLHLVKDEPFLWDLIESARGAARRRGWNPGGRGLG